MRKHKLLFLLAILLTGIYSFAQENYKSATIVTNGGDTLSGLIDYQNWERNPLFILFKQGESGRIHRHTPKDIQSFRVEGDYYFSAVVGVDITPRETDYLTYSAKPIIEVDTVFLSVYLLGKASLYALVDRDAKQHYYIEKDSSGIVELIYIKYLKQVQRKTTIQKNERYKGQLNYFFSDCPAMKKEISNTDFQPESLIDLFKNYNFCVEPNEETVQLTNNETRKAEFNFGFVAGATLTNLKFYSSEQKFDYLTEQNFSNSIKPTVGISLNIVFPRNRGKWALYNELAYRSYDYTEAWHEFIRENYFYDHAVSIGATYIKMSNFIRYQIPDKTVRMYFHLGIAHGYAFQIKNNYKVEKTFYGSTTVKNEPAISALRTYEMGIAGGVGAEFKKFSAEFRYEIGNGISSLINLSSTSHTFFFLLGYHF